MSECSTIVYNVFFVVYIEALYVTLFSNYYVEKAVSICLLNGKFIQIINLFFSSSFRSSKGMDDKYRKDSLG